MTIRNLIGFAGLSCAIASPAFGQQQSDGPETIFSEQDDTSIVMVQQTESTCSMTVMSGHQGNIFALRVNVTEAVPAVIFFADPEMLSGNEGEFTVNFYTPDGMQFGTPVRFVKKGVLEGKVYLETSEMEEFGRAMRLFSQSNIVTLSSANGVTKSASVAFDPQVAARAQGRFGQCYAERAG